jgi:hypothetical protein
MLDRPSFYNRVHFHIPYGNLASAETKFGYFDPSVVPSSNIDKEMIIGGSQSGTLV